MKRKIRFLLLILAAVCVFATAVPSASCSTAFAAVKQVKAVRKSKNAKKVKTGYTKVKCSKSSKEFTEQYVMFTASKSGTYRFKFSRFDDGTTGAESINSGFFLIYIKNANGTKSNVKFRSGSGEGWATDIIKSQEWINHIKKQKKTDKYKSTTYATLSLKKGNTIYLTSCFSTNTSYTYLLNAKKIK